VLKKCVFSLGAVMLLATVGFAAIGHNPSHPLVASCQTVIIGCGPIAHPYYYCGAIGFPRQTYIIGCHYPVIRRLCWWPCKPPCKSPCNSQCKPICKPPCIVKGGDATATVVSYNGSADPAAQAIGGDATLMIEGKPLCNQPFIVKGGDATAAATSYGGNADTIAHAVGGDAVVVIK
jgi:hypothetical protein